MNRELLETPFGQNEIKSRKGTFGKIIDYVEAHAVIQRLNDAFDGQWSFQIESYQIMENEVLVQGKLTAEGIIKSQFGSSVITKSRETGQTLSIADDMKAAATDSLKKAATMFGVGLHLYSGKEKPPVELNGQSQAHYPSNSNPKRTLNRYQENRTGYEPSLQSGYQNRGQTQESNSRLTQKQHSLILSLAGERGYTSKSLDDYSLNAFGCVIDFLSKNDASAMINQFLAN